MLRLKQIREENGLSQNELADKLKMTQQRISSYEKGIREPDLETLEIFADFFNVSTDYILGKTEIRNIRELRQVKFANAGGLDTNGLDEDELLELQKQIDFMEWKKKNK